MIFYRCASCDKINNNAFLCAYCECEWLFSAELGSSPDCHIPNDIPEIKEEVDDYLKCPMCQVYIDVAEVNCGIFRCGMTHGWINPHAPKEEIDRLKKDGKWLGGCGAPLKLNVETGALDAIYDGSGELHYI
jgi:rubredoxin